MKMNKYSFLTLFAVICLMMTACQKDDNNPDVSINYYTQEDYSMMSQYLNIPEFPLSYKLDFPDYYNTDFTNFDKDIATLGRVLFYDVNLSEDRQISCGSCHKQEIAFSDDIAFSEGINQKVTTRNTLALGSVFSFNEYYGAENFGRIPFFWDNRATTVAEQSKQTIANENEMGMEMDQVVDRVVEEPYYRPLFDAAYGRGTTVTKENVLEAISEFVNSMGSFSAKFDEGLNLESAGTTGFINLTNLANQDFGNFTAQENYGKAIYQQNCASCHSAILSAPPKARANNGLDVEYDDKGIGAMTGANADKGMFKVPTLRNIALTAPYMHDGRFQTLEEVIDHYSTGIQLHPNLDYDLRSGNGAKQFNFNADEKAALLAFLQTATDEIYIDPVASEKYSDPFKQ